MALSIFTPSVSGMDAQSHAMSTISTNIANLNTVGYKKSSTSFYTLLGAEPVVKGNNSGLYSSRVDVDGVGYYDRTAVTTQGVVTSALGNYNVAINGTGNAFFQVNDAEGRPYYTRAGAFETRTMNGNTYLIASNGYTVQGFAALEGGGFASSTSDIIINPLEKMPSKPTTQAEVTANVPASDVDSSSYGITVYGPNNDGQTMNMLFTKVEGEINTWEVTFTVENGTVVSEPVKAVFDDTGQLMSPQNINLTVNWDEEGGGGSNNVTLDISHMTQYAGSSGITHVSQDGRPSGDFMKSYIDVDGVLKAKYTNNQTIDIAKIAVVGFEAAENLDPVSNTMFQANPNCGNSYYLTENVIQPEALEYSNASIEEEFSNMVVVQRAYSMNAQSFTVTDEMLQEAVNIKT